jgi:monomeric sarcosine oxidase
MAHYDAIVLGAGGIGSAALYELARRGVRAIGIDRFSPPHNFGSSHGQTRVIRQAYFEHPDYVPLVVESYSMWRALEQLTGRRLLHEIGLIEIGPPGGVVVPGVLRAATEHRLAVEQLTASEIERRWPGLRVPSHLGGAYEACAGYLRVEECVQSYLDAAQAAGAELRFDVIPDDWMSPWSVDGNQVSVVTREGQITANRVIVTVGAWAGSLLSDLSLRLRVVRKSLYWFRTHSREYDVNNGMPVFLFELPQGIFYGFPRLDERGLKVAEHTGGRTVAHPNWVDRSPDPQEQDSLMRFLSSHLPSVTSEVTDHTVCLYTMSPDEHFIVDRHPAHANVAFAAGLSGHGFKFAPVLGRALVELVLDGSTDLPIEFLSLNRFGSRGAF